MKLRSGQNCGQELRKYFAPDWPIKGRPTVWPCRDPTSHRPDQMLPSYIGPALLPIDHLLGSFLRIWPAHME